MGDGMTHLPLTLGEYTTAIGNVEITRLGKGGKWAFSSNNSRWNVKTGRHNHMPEASITGRVEPAAGETFTIKWSPDPLMSKADEKAAPKAPRECWLDDGGTTYAERITSATYTRMIEAVPIEAELARVTAERDEAVALLRDYRGAMNYEEWGDWRTAFLAKIGGK